MSAAVLRERTTSTHVGTSKTVGRERYFHRLAALHELLESLTSLDQRESTSVVGFSSSESGSKSLTDSTMPNPNVLAVEPCLSLLVP